MIGCKLRGAVSAALLVVLGLASGRALAQDQAAIDRLVQMNKKALEDYDTLEWDAAKRTLLEALVAGKKAGLENHPVMARTYVHLGAVYIMGFKDRQKGLQSFARALEIDPSIKLSRAMSNPDLEDVFADAAKQGSRGGGSTTSTPPSRPPGRRRGPIMMDDNADSSASPPPSREEAPADEEGGGEPDLPLRINALDCPNKDEAPPDKSIPLRCAVAPNLPVAHVFLLFREPGKEDFTAVEMQKTPKGWFQGKIPKKVVTGKSVQFYYEGRNATGKPVVSNGRADSPNLILIVEKEAAKEAEAAAPRPKKRRRGVDDENPLEDKDSSGPRIYLGKVDRSRIGLDEHYGNRKWWIGLGAGTGYGYASGNLEARPDLQANFAPGLGWAGLGHLAIEIGYQIDPDIALSIQTRDQYIPQAAQYAKFTASGANSVLARGLFYTRQRQVRFYGSVMAGGGEGFRFVIKPDSTRPNFQDTIRSGPILAGAGLGLYYEASKPVSLVFEINGLAGFPAFSVVADFNLALQVNIY
jgi:hypothetical protein